MRYSSRLASILVGLLAAAAAARAQDECGTNHWRWCQKTDQSPATTTPKRAYVTTMLRSWDPPDLFYGKSTADAPRAGRELQSWYVIGWVRRVRETQESDGDWHIELTASKDSPRDQCIIAEIPPTDPGGNFGKARSDLQAMIAGSTMDHGTGEIDPPVRVKIIGAAFFDAEHRGAKATRPMASNQHGTCNDSARALWEIHPVYWVQQP